MRTHRPWRTWLAIFFVLIAAGAPKPAAAGTLSPDLANLLKLGGLLTPARIIIQTNGAPTSSLLLTIKLLGGTVYGQFGVIDGLAVQLPLGQIPVLLARTDVSHISRDLPVLGALDLSSAAVGATTARNSTGLSGAGVGVAVLDTGIAQHSDLSGRVVGWKDIVNGRSTPYDDSGHGTHVAGIIAGSGAAAAKAGKDLRGMAPGANLIGVKVLDANMHGSVSDVIKGLDYCFGKQQQLGIRIVNLSMGAPINESYTTDPFCKAVERLWKNGVVVVVSAGNLGRKVQSDPNSGVQYGTITCPGNDPLVITVGATRTNYTADRSDDEMATYSSRGPSLIDHVAKPDIVAPGNRVWSLGCNGALSASATMTTLGGASYMQLSGTSMAAPMVSGAVSLLLQGAPGISPDTVKIRLMHSAVKRWNYSVPEYSPYDRGAGLLNIPGALAQPENATQLAASPIVNRGSDTNDLWITGGNALWGDTQQWSGGYLWTDSAVWASMAPSSSSSSQSDQLIWGEPSVWADQTTWADDSASSQDQLIWGEPAPSGD